LWAWWGALHVLLAAAAALVGWPASLEALALVAIVAHGLSRRPPASPKLIVVSEDGFCAVPEWQTGRRPLGDRTLVCLFWVRLDLGQDLRQRDILLIADQLRPEEWRRLRALLARTRGE
jgi:hypothetical protein